MLCTAVPVHRIPHGCKGCSIFFLPHAFRKSTSFFNGPHPRGRCNISGFSCTRSRLTLTLGRRGLGSTGSPLIISQIGWYSDTPTRFRLYLLAVLEKCYDRQFSISYAFYEYNKSKYRTAVVYLCYCCTSTSFLRNIISYHIISCFVYLFSKYDVKTRYLKYTIWLRTSYIRVQHSRVQQYSKAVVYKHIPVPSPELVWLSGLNIFILFFYGSFYCSWFFRRYASADVLSYTEYFRSTRST